MPEIADLPTRFTEKIRDTGTCWEWTAFKQSNGYGKVYFEGRVALAHRAVYTLLVSRPPAHLVLDHLCRNRWCVNPAHLRIVTRRANLLAPGSLAQPAINVAKVHCPEGHPLTNRGSGVGRICLICARDRDRRRWPKRAEDRRRKIQARRNQA